MIQFGRFYFAVARPETVKFSLVWQDFIEGHIPLSFKIFPASGAVKRAIDAFYVVSLCRRG